MTVTLFPVAPPARRRPRARPSGPVVTMTDLRWRLLELLARVGATPAKAAGRKLARRDDWDAQMCSRWALSFASPMILAGLITKTGPSPVVLSITDEGRRFLLTRGRT